MKDLPKYTKNKKKGNIGEAIAQYVLSTFTLVHKIDGANDIGNDFICELLRDEYPTNLLFYVQVKYTQEKPKIRPQTLTYWKGSPIPVYLFWIKDKEPSNTPLLPWTPPIDPGNLAQLIKYKRCTPFLHKKKDQETEGFSDFKKLPFIEHLIRDYLRISYAQGFTPILNAQDFLSIDEKNEIGLGKHHFYIKDVILEREYSKKIIENGWANMFSLAANLSKKDTKKDTLRAIKILEAAKMIVTKRDKRKYEDILKDMDTLYKKLKLRGV